MRLTEIPALRLINQKITGTEFSSLKDIVSWMGAMQAQDFQMAKLAAGIRLKTSSCRSIEESFDRGDVLRTHLLRPTWHFVAAEDIHWMLQLTAPHVRSAVSSRQKQLEITDDLHAKSQRILEKALDNGRSLTREELAGLYEKAGIITSNNRLAHLLLYAELNGLICSGAVRDKKQTWTLLSCRVPYGKTLARDEALAGLANRYFKSHGPATLFDFAWWSGLSMKDAKLALDSVKPGFISETIGLKEYWFNPPSINLQTNKTKVHLLPAYDEFLISYRDRSASLNLIENKKVVSDNGIFRPVILLNGQVAGVWKSTYKNKLPEIELSFFKPPSGPVQKITKSAAEAISDFLGKPAKISINNFKG